MGVPFLYPVDVDRSAPWDRVVGRMQYAPTGTRQTWLASLMPPAKFAGVRRRPYAIRPYMGTRHFLYPAKFAGVRRRPFLLCFLILFLPPFSVTPSRTVPSAT